MRLVLFSYPLKFNPNGLLRMRMRKKCSLLFAWRAYQKSKARYGALKTSIARGEMSDGKKTWNIIFMSRQGGYEYAVLLLQF